MNNKKNKNYYDNIERRRAYQREYYKKNKEKVKKYQILYNRKKKEINTKEKQKFIVSFN